MPKPVALCIEHIDAPIAQRFVVCTSLAGGQPGLGFSKHGEVTWLADEDRVVQLWVSMDEKLILYRCQHGPDTSVHRAGRSLVVPEEKPVVLLHEDEIRLAGRRLRVHVHGQTDTVAAPKIYVPQAQPRQSRGIPRAVAAAAVALSVGSVSCAKTGIEVRDERPMPAFPDDTAPVEPPPPDAPPRAVAFYNRSSSSEFSLSSP